MAEVAITSVPQANKWPWRPTALVAGSQSRLLTAIGFHLPYILAAAVVNVGVVMLAALVGMLGVLVSFLLFACARKSIVYSSSNAVFAGFGWAVVLVFATLPGPRYESAFSKELRDQPKQTSVYPQP
ncbi:MAG TPA: hypothetical protein VE988_28910 [Gemmataceae bacterium]|nr:hypothetical protein [Gemmataceae bacterium]